jgi:hypothetical protein
MRVLLLKLDNLCVTFPKSPHIHLPMENSSRDEEVDQLKQSEMIKSNNFRAKQRQVAVINGRLTKILSVASIAAKSDV